MSIVKGALLSDISEFYKGEITLAGVGTATEAGRYKIVYTQEAAGTIFGFSSDLFVNTKTVDDALTNICQTSIAVDDSLRQRFSTDAGATWGAWESVSYLSDLTPILSDISKLKTNHTTITTPAEGQMAWNTTTKKPVWYNGTKWIYADGTDV